MFKQKFNEGKKGMVVPKLHPNMDLAEALALQDEIDQRGETKDEEPVIEGFQLEIDLLIDAWTRFRPNNPSERGSQASSRASRNVKVKTMSDLKKTVFDQKFMWTILSSMKLYIYDDKDNAEQQEKKAEFDKFINKYLDKIDDAQRKERILNE